MKNNYKIVGEEVYIFIKDDVYTIIDKEDLILMDNISTWFVHIVKNKIYIRGNNKIEKKYVYLHRYITKAPKDKVVDHDDGNPLNNRRKNLIITTQDKNVFNRKGAQHNSKTGYRGITQNKSGTFLATVQYNGNIYKKNSFKTVDDANNFAISLREELIKNSPDLIKFGNIKIKSVKS